MIGQTVSHYRVVAKLGEGGMGVVYKAQDTQLGRFDALKVLPPEKVTSEDRKARFMQEARAASMLNHPNIITVYEISQEAGVDFIAMEYVDTRRADTALGDAPGRGFADCQSGGGRAGESPRGRHHSPRLEAVEHHGFQ
jgi:predicted Ser/Thr protein kinase